MLRDNSLICTLLFNNGEWGSVLEDKRIRITTDGNYAIFNYGIECDFSDPYVCEARGIIIDLDTCHVVCRGFDKFFNVQEKYAAKIDWNSAVVQEKVDGSIIKIWWSEKLNRWVVSTNSVIFSEKAPCGNMWSFYDIVLKSENYKDIMTTLDLANGSKSLTYIFELVSPYNQMVIKYDRTVLCYLGARENATGREYDLRNIFYPVPKIYPLKTLNDCLNAVNELNTGDKTVRYEGFVVVDKDYHRIKIKSPEYLVVHRLINNHVYNKEKIISLVLSNRKNEIDEFDNDVFRLYKKYYDFQVSLFEFQLEEFLDYCLRVDEEYNHDRKAIALVIKDNKYSGYGFELLFKGKTKSDILNNLNERDYYRYIEDFSKIIKGDIKGYKGV